MVLKLNGKPLELNPLSPTAQKTLDFLKKQPADELFTGAQLAAKIGCGAEFFKDRLGTNPAAAPFSLSVRGKRYWGNPRAIAELKRQVAG